MIQPLPALFVKLLDMSLEASLAALAVIVLRLLFRSAPKWTHCLLWSLVAIKLLCPILPQSDLSLMPSVNPVEQTVTAISTASQTAANDTAAASPGAPIADSSPSGEPAVTRHNAPEPTTGQTDPTSAVLLSLAAVWLIGVLIIAGRSALVYVRLRRKVADAVLLREPIYLSDRVPTAFLFGILHPRIYLPFGISDVNAQQIIAHEQAHLRRHDHLTKPLAYALAAVYWFNPVMWLSYFLYCRDVELACDERVVRGQSIEQRKAYSRALLECSSDCCICSVSNAFPIAFGKIAVKRRVLNVLKHQKPALWLTVAVLAAAAVAGIVLLTRPGNYRTDIPDALDKAISTAIFEQENAVYTEVTPSDLLKTALASNASAFYGDGHHRLPDVECYGEGHIILGTKESKDSIDVYALCSVNGYGFRDGYFVDNTGYSRVPTRFTFAVSDDGSGGSVYTLQDVKEAEDGSHFKPSVYRLFPRKVADKCFRLYDVGEIYQELELQCDRCAAAYLTAIGRSAKISSYYERQFEMLDDYGVSAEVSNALLEVHPDEDSYLGNYGIYLGNFETVEEGVRYVYSVTWTPDPDVYGDGTVLYLKYEYDSGKEIQKFLYEIKGDQFTRVPLTSVN